MKNINDKLDLDRNVVRKVLNFGEKFINYKLGLIGAVGMGSLIFGINYYDSQDLSNSLIAGLKQGGYTFLFGGGIMKGCEYFATKIRKKIVALAFAVIIPSVMSISATYTLHSVKGTPKPFESTIPTLLLVPPSTAIFAYKKRKNLEEYLTKSKTFNT
jgi:hypothetical protein